MLKLFRPKSPVALVNNKLPKTTFSFSSDTLSISSSPSVSPVIPSLSNLNGAIVNCKTSTQALQLLGFVLKRGTPFGDLQLHSALVHLLTRWKLNKHARCLIKCLIQKNMKSHNFSLLVFKNLNRLDKPKSNCYVLGVLIIALSEMGLIDEALWVYKNMEVLPKLQACNSLLHGLVKLAKFDSMWEFHEDMVSRGLVSSVVTYGILIDGCCRQGEISKGSGLFNEMISKGIEPTVVIFTTLIRGMCSEGKLIQAEQIFTSMQDSGVVPNLYTNNILMDGYCKANNVKRALGLYQGMVRDGFQPNIVTFGILIDALCKTGEVVAGRNLFVSMAKYGIIPSITIYNCLINGHCMVNNLCEAVGLHYEMEKLQVLPDVFTYSIIIKCLCNLGQVREADDLLIKMKREGIHSNSVTYNSLINGYCKKGDMEKALEICTKMTAEGIEPNVVTFSTLIDGYCKVGNLKSAMSLFSEMLVKSIVPDVVIYTALIDGHCKDGNMKAALWLQKEMLEAGVLPNIFTIGCLIDGLCKNETVSDAIHLFVENTKDSGHLSRNCVVYTSLIKQLFKDGRVFEASELFSDIRRNGINPDIAAYSAMLRGHLKSNQFLNVMMLRCDMIKIGMMPKDAIDEAICEIPSIKSQ